MMYLLCRLKGAAFRIVLPGISKHGIKVTDRQSFIDITQVCGLSERNCLHERSILPTEPEAIGERKRKMHGATEDQAFSDIRRTNTFR